MLDRSIEASFAESELNLLKGVIAAVLAEYTSPRQIQPFLAPGLTRTYFVRLLDRLVTSGEEAVEQGMPEAEMVEVLYVCLRQLERDVDAPHLDLQWLRARCEDTLRRTGEAQRDSFRQLRRDVREFAEEFPNLIPPSLMKDLAG
jgi:hypothetical protein